MLIGKDQTPENYSMLDKSLTKKRIFLMRYDSQKTTATEEKHS